MADTQSTDLHDEASYRLHDLVCTLAVMDAMIQVNPDYADARSGWNQRLREVRDWANRQVEEITEFASSFDT